MLESIELNFTETGKLVLPTKGITVFVGPNNSGKSLVLKEIEEAFSLFQGPLKSIILKDFQVSWPTIEQVNLSITKNSIRSSKQVPTGHVEMARISQGGREVHHIHEESFRSQVKIRSNKHYLMNQYLKWGVLRLDGRSRFNLTNDQLGEDLLGPPQNTLAHLFQDDPTRRKVRKLVNEAFDLNFVIDPTNLGQLRVRLSTKPVLTDEQSLNAEARKFFSEAIHIKDASDGVQAFTGIVTAVCSGEFHTILIDEPEAFLHPPLARKLGKNLSEIAGERDGILMASTHSSDFLMGCVQGSTPVQVVRLEYSNGKSRARVINHKVLEGFLKRPLMRSANVISALFHDGVVILESDNDRAFYSEIYYRLSEGRSGYPSILFVNAQNKQTIKDIMGPLREFGVPAAAIPDIDIVKDGGKVFTDWLTGAKMPEMLHIGLGQQRASVLQALKESGKDMKNDGGLEILEGDKLAAADEFFSSLEKYGVFTVRRGELEDWLPNLNVPGKKTDWTIAMLERLGGDPVAEDYVKAGTDDVWAFIEKVVGWIKDAGRKGT
ncbi:ATP-dependent nuclease [Asticcacaulis tiandongensis]|uniref:ATP-dependent nuclease n=1 Tax=Asticcacaulis tiandongensis TaxID=2565365 RepID=UPI001127ED0F|nr:AAA family ATPase [Asticcacaulis tiandongensis]